MKTLRAIRIILAVIFLAASILCLVATGNLARAGAPAAKVQIVLSALSATAGTTLVWLMLTLLGGRFYCSTVCPIGTISDAFLHIRNHTKGLKRPFSYRHRSKVSVHILWIYLLCVILGVFVIPYLVEPWNIMRNLASTVNPDAVTTTWFRLGLSLLFGIVGGIVGLIAVMIMSLLQGRRFCTDFCPVGIGLGYLSNYSFYHIEIDPDKCTSCGLCEEICRSSCIKNVSRYVDNTRCVRCLDCVARCPEDAIHLQYNRNRPATPLMTRVKKAK